MTFHPCRAAATAVLLLAPALTSQHDMIGVTFVGQSVAFDSRTGEGVLLTTNSERGVNAMARRGNELFVVESLVPAGGTTTVYPIGRIDARTGIHTRNVGLLGDLRGMSDHPTNSQLLYGILEGPPDLLVLIDLSTVTMTTIGSTGRNGIQALARVGQQLFAWDITAGLLRINPNTGFATDVNPVIGGTADIQFLTAHHDGRLIGGRLNLYEINRTTGDFTLIGPLAGGAFDVRGADERMPLNEVFGTGCGSSPPPALTASGGAAAGNQLALFSNNHQPQRLAVQILGFSHVSYQGTALPLSLDPLLGTVGCNLLVSPELTSVGTTNLAGQFSGNFVLPPGSAEQQFFVQHAVFENVPGGLALTNAVMIKIGV